MIESLLCREREIWIVPHYYSCGGFWMAERFPVDTGYHYQGQEHTDGLGFFLLSGRMEVLSRHQAEQRLDCCRDRGEDLTVVWADALPEGGRLINLR